MFALRETPSPHMPGCAPNVRRCGIGLRRYGEGTDILHHGVPRQVRCIHRHIHHLQPAEVGCRIIGQGVVGRCPV